jgi:hypothetical protein
MSQTVWVEAWEQACCGDAFAEGSEVNWTLVPPSDGLARIFRVEDGVAVDAVESHHGPDVDRASRTIGVVESIRLVHINYSSESDSNDGNERLIPGSAKVTRVRDSTDARTREREFAGFLVVLRT